MKDERGITLVELLATIVIVSLVVSLIMGIQITVQKQFQTQTKKAEQLIDLTIAMKSITKDLRAAREIEVPSENHLRIKDMAGQIVEYTLENEVLQRNHSHYIYKVNRFFVEERENDKILIFVESETGKKLETEIMLRRE